MVSVPGRRLQVAQACKRWKLPLRRACTLLSVARSSARYASKREVADALVVKRMRELAAQYPRYGYRRIRIFLGRDGHRMSVDRALRLWRASRLQVPRRRPRRRIATGRPRPTPLLRLRGCAEVPSGTTPSTGASAIDFLYSRRCTFDAQ